jgi:hypothetical protein
MRIGDRYDRAIRLLSGDDIPTRLVGALLLTVWAVRLGLMIGIGLAAVVFAIWVPL